MQYDCIMMNGTPSCPTGPRGNWEPCYIPPITPSSYFSSSSAASSSADSGTGNPNDSGSDDGVNSAASGGGGGGGSGPDGSSLIDFTLAEGASLVDSTGALPRFTASGQRCMDQWNYMGVTYGIGECVVSEGRELCQTVKGGMLLECAPIVQVPVSSTWCYGNAVALAAVKQQLSSAAAAASSGSSSTSDDDSSLQAATSAFDECVMQLGLEFCRMSDGTSGSTSSGFGPTTATNGSVWVRCSGGSARAAVDEEGFITHCSFPFSVGGLSRSDCVYPANCNSTSDSYCPISTSTEGTSGAGLQLATCLHDTLPYNLYGSVADGAASAGGVQQQQGLDKVGQLLQGLVAAPGSGTRRYSLFSQVACLPLWSPKSATALESWRDAGGGGVDSLSGSDESSSSSAATAAGGGSGGDAAATSYREPGTPAAGAGVCVLDDERGRFECTTTVSTCLRDICCELWLVAST